MRTCRQLPCEVAAQAEALQLGQAVQGGSEGEEVVAVTAGVGPLQVECLKEGGEGKAAQGRS